MNKTNILILNWNSQQPGGMNVDDRALSVLDNYEFKVLRTWKGRGAILFDTDQGTKILKEYIGPKEKALVQDLLVRHIKSQGIEAVDGIEKNKEGERITEDNDKKTYIVKEYMDGKECNIWEIEECKEAVRQLAKLHKAMEMNNEKECILLPIAHLERDFEKHNKELKRIKNFIRGKGQKTDFEIFLMQHYDYFYEQAITINAEMRKEDWTPLYEDVKRRGTICHGDYQYHNIRLKERIVAIINFEKYVLDSQNRDLYLFMRKVLEKNTWDKKIGNTLLQTYETVKPLTELERKQLYFRIAYPEKFWKIVNFYYNSGKSWIPMRHMDKLQKLISQEELKQQFLQKFK